MSHEIIFADIWIFTLPNDEQLLSELESFRYELTERGKIRISVPDGLHDDCVMAVALAVWQLSSKPIVPFQADSPMIRIQGYNQNQWKDITDDFWNCT